MKEILIIGAGDLGKEVVWLIEDINKYDPSYLILGFLDADQGKLGQEFYGYRVLGAQEKLREYKDTQVCAVIAMQDGNARKKAVSKAGGFSKWETLVHPTAVIASSACLGKGSIVFPRVTISVDSRLGDFGLYYINSTICNDCVLGGYVSVMAGVSVSEHVAIGECSYLSAGVTVFPHKVLGRNVKAGAGSNVARDCGDNVQINGKRNLFILSVR